MRQYKGRVPLVTSFSHFLLIFLSFLKLIIYDRWEGERLSGPSKIIFDALNEFVRDTAEQFLHQEGHDITKKLQALVSTFTYIYIVMLD